MTGESDTIPETNKQPAVTQPAAPIKPTVQPAFPLPGQPKKFIFKKWWLWTIIGILILGLITSIFLFLPIDNSQNTNTSTNDENYTDLLNCLNIQSKLSILDEGYTFINTENNSISIQVERKESNVTLRGIKVVLTNADNSITKNWSAELPLNNGAAVQVFDGESFDYTTTKEISIAAIVNLKGKETICETSHMIKTSSLLHP